jgi:hypothetical protein
MVEEKKPEGQSSGFILPDDYKTKELHKVVRLLAASSGSPYVDSVNNLVLVPANMVEEIKAFGNVYLLVPEAAIYGVFYR